MKRGALVAAALVVLAIVGASVWLLQRSRASEEATSRARAAHDASPSELPTLSLPAADPARSRALAEGSPEPAATPIAAAAVPASSTLRLTVVDERSAPIADARVVLKSQLGSVLTTGADGVATITAAPGSEVDISARHPDFRFNVLHAVMPLAGAPPGEATIVLSTELSACVRVVDERGRPIEGANIGFREIRNDDLRLGVIATPDELNRADWSDTFKGVLQETRTTGPDGRCCVQGITAGKALLTAQADGFVSVTYHPVDVGPRGGDLGELQLSAARTLAGTVVDASGPVPGALVETRFGGRNIGGYVTATTDADGRFKFTMVPPSNTKIALRASHETRGDFFDEELLVTDDPVTLRLHPSLDVTLRLRDATTKAPVTGKLTITTMMQDTSLLLMRLREPRSMASVNGELHVGWVPYFASRLQIEAAGFAKAIVEIAQMEAAGGAPIDVDLVRTGAIAIHAIDGSTGLPVVGAKFGVRYEGPSPNGPKDKYFVNSNFQVSAPFDEATGAYVLDTSVFTFAPGADETLFVSGPDGKSSGTVPVSTKGVRVCGEVIEVTLQPRQATSPPKPK